MGLSLYSVDGGISQANSMAQGIQNANLQIQAQNDLAAENYNEQREVDKTQATNDKILKKHMSENQTLKKQLASGGGSASGPSGSPTKRAEVLPAKRDFKSMRA